MAGLQALGDEGGEYEFLRKGVQGVHAPVVEWERI